jgi:hypothetical protein
MNKSHDFIMNESHDFLMNKSHDFIMNENERQKDYTEWITCSFVNKAKKGGHVRIIYNSCSLLH